MIEEILQEEIIDETDKYIDVARRIQVANLRRRISKSTLLSSTSASRASSKPHGVVRVRAFYTYLYCERFNRS